MFFLSRRLVAVLLLLLFLPGLPRAGTLAADDSERAMTARVDSLLQRGWKNAGVKPAPPASDSAFLRRAYLDLTGRIPTVGEVRDFLADHRPDKRARLIDRLLGTPAAKGRPRRAGNSRHAAHLAGIWRQVMLPQVNNNARFRYQAVQFETWLRNHFADNTPYNRIVTELLTYSGPVNRTGPGLFYQVLELKPEELAASTSRIFLGVQIQCAQCHDHPFDHWTKNDFWGYAAFFARLQRPQGRQRFVAQVAETNSGEVKLPGTHTVVPPRYLGQKTAGKETGTEDAPGKESAAGNMRRRKRLARWLTAAENPYFAKATVNRVWALLFGRGLVDPVDDFGKHNPPSHPQLLDELGADFVQHGYNLRRLFRILAKSRAYQLSSQIGPEEAEYPHLFNRMAVKSLTPAQIYDCLLIATAKREAVNTGTAQASRFRFNQERDRFLAKFEAPTQGTTEYQGGIPQALTMMNGALMATATDVNRSDILISVAEAPFLNTEQRVETLFLATLSRMPTEKERAQFIPYVEAGGRSGDSRKALGDVLWALLNSTEFLLNH